MNPTRTSLLLMLIVMSAGAGFLRAEEETSTHRIVGLFSPDREEDFRAIVATMPQIKLVSFNYETTEAVLGYDVSKLIPNFNPKKPPTAEVIAKRLDDRLRAASQGTFTLKPLAEIPPEKQQAVEIKIGVLDCKGCRYGAYLAVAKMDGVERATVSAEKSTLTAWIDPAKTDRAALEAALKKARVELPAP